MAPPPRPPQQKQRVARFRNVGSVTDLKKEIERFRAQSRILDQVYVASVLDPEHGQGARVPSQFPVMSTSNHFHQTIYLKSSSTGDMVMEWYPGASFAGAASTAYNQPFRYYASPTIMTQFTAGFPVTNGATNFLNNPMNSVNFIEDSRLVSCAMVFTYTGPPLTASGSFNAAWFQYSLQSNNVLQRSGVDLAPSLQVGAATAGFRTIWTPRDVDDTVFRKQTDEQAAAYFCAYLTGLPPNLDCARVDLYWNYEFIPNLDYQSILEMEKPSNDQDAVEYVAELVDSNDSLRYLNGPTAAPLSAAMKHEPGAVRPLLENDRDYSKPGTVEWIGQTLAKVAKSTLTSFLAGL